LKSFLKYMICLFHKFAAMRIDSTLIGRLIELKMLLMCDRVSEHVEYSTLSLKMVNVLDALVLHIYAAFELNR